MAGDRRATFTKRKPSHSAIAAACSGKSRLVEPVDLVHVWRADEPPVGGVGPRVIRALNRLGELARSFTADPGAAMPADVEERAQLAVAVAHDDQRFPGDVSHDVVARLREPARSADAIPLARENAFALFDEDRRATCSTRAASCARPARMLRPCDESVRHLRPSVRDPRFRRQPSCSRRARPGPDARRIRRDRDRRSALQYRRPAGDRTHEQNLIERHLAVRHRALA